VEIGEWLRTKKNISRKMFPRQNWKIRLCNRKESWDIW